MHSRVPTEPPGESSAPDEPDGVTTEQVDAGPTHAPGDRAPGRATPPPRTPQPTIWVQGHHPGRLVLRACSLLLLLVTGLEIALAGGIGIGFDLAFVAVCVLAALWVRPADFFSVGVYPPLALGAVVVVLAVVEPGTVARASDPVGQAMVSGLAHRAWPLVVGYGLTLAIIALRQVALRNDGRLRLRG